MDYEIVYINTKYSLKEPIVALDFYKQHKKEQEDFKPLVCKINDKLMDLNTVISESCKLEFCTYADEALMVFRHSSAHVLGKAIMETYPGSLISSGPPTENGFYYDVLFPIGTVFNESCYEKLEKNIKKIIKSKEKFIPQEYSKDELLEMFKYNKYKLHYINRMKEESSTIYNLGNFIDFCKGPHIPDVSYIKEFKITHHGGSYFLGEATNDQLTRIYGISFPKKGMMKEYERNIEEAKKRNHRTLGKSLDLFFFSDISPGSCFFLPKGTYIYNKLVNLMREEYINRGFKEVITPNVFSTKLWETSGHLKNYRDDMFFIENAENNDEYALKPMNCPGHCVIFNSQSISYKNLPLRYADFGVLHRNELSGALTGLTRVRKFSQDDAHIFCEEKDIEKEIKSCLEFVDKIYGIFGFKYELFLSTRPEKYMGALEEWDKAENQLKKALENHKYKINEGDGAFYGPKIDFILKDSLNKKIQCSTIQLDFQLPRNFNLSFINREGIKERPIMIHRAILGSIERFFAIILENFGKNLPFWLSPNQIALINFSASEKYINTIKEELSEFQIKYFDDNDKPAKQIRNAIEKSYKLILVVGKIEEENKKVKIYKKDEFYELKEIKGRLREIEMKKINDFSI